MLYKVPDLTNSLLRGLTRFREDRISVMADFQSMFYQVRIPEKDSFFLRFLWWGDDNMTTEAKKCQMLVRLFEAVPSPACANFALRRTAEDNQNTFTVEVIDTVKRNF